MDVGDTDASPKMARSGSRRTSLETFISPVADAVKYDRISRPPSTTVSPVAPPSVKQRLPATINNASPAHKGFLYKVGNLSTPDVPSTSCHSPRHADYNDIDQGWVSINKPKSFRLLKKGEDHNFEMGVIPATNSNRASIPSSEDAARDSCSGSPLQSVEQRQDCLNDWVVSDYSWLAERIRQCGEQVEVTINSCDEDWDSAVRFIEEKNAQFRTTTNSATDTKIGKREVVNPPCSITYKRSRRPKGQQAGKTESKLNGDELGQS